MATKAHKLLTGTDLHEPKGVAGAPAGQVYVSDGAGSGAWTTINTGIQFSTGDTKFTFKTVADAGWLIPVDGNTIGSDTSGATFASTALYSPLYQLIWNNVSNTYAAVTGGRGGSAAADFAANKKMAFPAWMSRAIGVAGSGTGLTTRALGSNVGVEAEALTLSQLPTGITSANTAIISLTVNSPSANIDQGIGISNVAAGGNAINTVSAQNFLFSTGTLAIGAVPVTSNNTGGTTHSLMQPTVFLNLMIKY